MSKLKVAVVTGGHPFDLPSLQSVFQEVPDLEVYFQHMDDWTTAGEGRKGYDVVVFYQMLMEGPLDKGAWYQGNVRQALEELGQTEQGIVVWHHSILAYPQWEFWSKLVGISNRKFVHHPKQQVPVHISDPAHPITRGLQDWEMPDETYAMDEPSAEGNHALLTVDHPLSMKTIAWTREFGKARVFCFQSGHDGQTFENPNFREILLRAIRWTAAKSFGSTVPAAMPAIWFVEKGVTAIRHDPTPVCNPGHILCRTLYTGVTNGTERNVMMGGNYGGSWPGRCGYQNVGQVIEVASNVKEYAVGDVVFTGNFSQHQLYFTLDASDPNSPRHLVIKIPGSVDRKHAALFGMASVAMRDVRWADIGIGDSVLVVGAGPIGQFTAQAARAAGAIVTVVDLDAKRLDLARSCGAHRVIRVEAGKPWDEVRKIAPFDAVFEDSGAPVLDQVIGTKGEPGLVKRQGTVVMVAGRDRVDYSFNAGQNTALQVRHVGHFGRDDLQQLCRLVEEGVIKIGPIIQDVLPFTDAIPFYERLRDNPASTFGTILDWTGA